MLPERFKFHSNNRRLQISYLYCCYVIHNYILNIRHILLHVLEVGVEVHPRICQVSHGMWCSCNDFTHPRRDSFQFNAPLDITSKNFAMYPCKVHKINIKRESRIAKSLNAHFELCLITYILQYSGSPPFDIPYIQQKNVFCKRLSG